MSFRLGRSARWARWFGAAACAILAMAAGAQDTGKKPSLLEALRSEDLPSVKRVGETPAASADAEKSASPKKAIPQKIAASEKTKAPATAADSQDAPPVPGPPVDLAAGKGKLVPVDGQTVRIGPTEGEGTTAPKEIVSGEKLFVEAAQGPGGKLLPGDLAEPTQELKSPPPAPPVEMPEVEISEADVPEVPYEDDVWVKVQGSPSVQAQLARSVLPADFGLDTSRLEGDAALTSDLMNLLTGPPPSGISLAALEIATPEPVEEVVAPMEPAPVTDDFINVAAASELMKTLDLDFRRARKIVEFRTIHNRFQAPEDLAQVAGIDDARVIEWEAKGLLGFN